jgi:hypothetical protein
MRLTCLKCGQQIELSTWEARNEPYTYCVCATEHVIPHVSGPSTFPSDRAAVATRTRAFRAAGIAKNTGRVALSVSLAGSLLFPLSLLGIGMGTFVHAGLPEPLRIHSGFRQAIAAIVAGVLILVLQIWFLANWFEDRSSLETSLIQEMAQDELVKLRRVQLRFHEENGRYGKFSELDFNPIYGRYTLYLDHDDFIEARDENGTVQHNLPFEFVPTVRKDSFRAVAVNNLDDDSELDIWVIEDNGRLVHEVDDLQLTP